MKLQEVRASALALPRRSREKLLHALADSLEDGRVHDCPPGVLSEDDPNFEAVLEKRLRAYERGEVKGIPLETVRKRLFKNLDKNRSSAPS